MAKRAKKLITLTAKITPAVSKQLSNYARAFRHTRSSAIQSILEQFLDYDNWFIKEVQEGIDSLDRGEGIPHEEAMRQLDAHIADAKRKWRLKRKRKRARKAA